MGIYTEYLGKRWSFPDLEAERKAQLRRISDLRQRDILVYAADPRAEGPIDIRQEDILPLCEQLTYCQRNEIDLILETPGGSGEIAEQIVRILRERFESVSVIVPGSAKSAGTIMAMAADDILMDEASALGPIDAQLFWQGKVFSADALLKGLDRIKSEVEREQRLNLAYVPILQALSPGELEHAHNALQFAQELVQEWLEKYKFKFWMTHTSTGQPVTDEEKKVRAKEIAQQLCDHSKWRTHGRSIRLPDLQSIGLKITNFGLVPPLADAIRRYFVLLQMTFDTTAIYKVFETPVSQIYRFIAPTQAAPAEIPSGQFTSSLLTLACPKCAAEIKVQADLGEARPLKPGHIRFPADNRVTCSVCKSEIDLTEARGQIELQSKARVVSSPAEGEAP